MSRSRATSGVDGCKIGERLSYRSLSLVVGWKTLNIFVE